MIRQSCGTGRGFVILRQFFDATSSTYTYLLASGPGREALLIDPVREKVDDYLKAVEALSLRLVRAVDTHVHADHVTGLGALRDATGCVTLMGERSRAECVSGHLREGEVINLEGVRLGVLDTPGHTDDSLSLVLDPERPRAVFTGDILLIRGTGRTDFQNGDPEASWDSIVGKLFRLPDETVVYPAHDYKGWTSSTIGEEKRYNPRLAGKTRAEYVALMRALKLPDPKLMDIAVSANLHCGQSAS